MRDTNVNGTDWIDLCPVSDLPREGGRYIEVSRRSLAVFREGETVRVIDDACPHAGGSLSAGTIQDGCVVCPLHAWPFHLQTGQCPDNPTITVRSYPVRVTDDGRVQVKLTVDGP